MAKVNEAEEQLSLQTQGILGHVCEAFDANPTTLARFNHF